MKKKIIVLGAAGHVGAYTIDYLLNNLDLDRFEIIASGRREVEYYKVHNITYIKVDICNSIDFEKLPTENVYAMINLAGIMPASMKGYDPYPFVDVNIRGNLNVLEYCRKVGCNKYIFTTTEADLSGYWEPGAVIDADLPAKFDYASNYAMYIISRRTVMEMAQSYKEKYGIINFAIRCSTVYCYTESPYMYKMGKKIIPGYLQIYAKAMSGEDIEVWGNPSVKTDVVYVKDFSQIVERIISLEELNGGVYNIGTGMPVTLEDQIKIAIDVFSSKERRSHLVYRPDMPNGRDFCMDISKTCRDLGYHPRYDYKSYLEDYKKEMELNRFSGLFTARSDD